MMQEKLNQSFEFLKPKIKSNPTTAIVLGSGLGSLADELQNKITINCEQIPHYPKPRVAGHAGKWIIGQLGDQSIIALKGRVHTYEGYSAFETTYPIRLLSTLGVRNLVVTNAAGGINKNFQPGDLMIITDHINLLFDNPLIGNNAISAEERFVDLFEAYDGIFIQRAKQVAAELGIKVQTGILVTSKGPSYETAAEIRMSRILGGDAATMSTVPEVIVARQMRIRVLGMSCITNLATGIGDKKLSHEEVTETADRIKDTFVRLMKEILKRMPSW
ncbi:MAG: purine-nucleoside phosphorylase [Candidatus Zhuqueibacterota bacterium]